jgi:O-methyltransferase
LTKAVFAAGLGRVPKHLLRSGLRRLGLDVVRHAPSASTGPADATARDREILGAIAPFTMTSVDRQLALIQATRHVAREGIGGCFVECGVWRGGSAMAIALTLLQEGAGDREIVLYDTFDGMTAPAAIDRNADGTAAAELLGADPARRSEVWAVAGLNAVRRNLASTGYPAHRLRYIAGDVTQTLPDPAPPSPIALLRLDTDWHASTRHELLHLYPRVVAGGVVIIDDYGDWQGARQAVDEYLATLPAPRPLLQRIDSTGRLVIKPAPPSGQDPRCPQAT